MIKPLSKTKEVLFGNVPKRFIEGPMGESYEKYLSLFGYKNDYPKSEYTDDAALSIWFDVF